MYEVMLESDLIRICTISDIKYLNYDMLIYMSKEAGADVVIYEAASGEEALRIGKGHDLNG